MLLPFSASDVEIALTQSPQDRENQCHSHASNLIDQDIGGVGDPNPFLDALVEIDLVDLQHRECVDEVGIGVVHGVDNGGTNGSGGEVGGNTPIF